MPESARIKPVALIAEDSATTRKILERLAEERGFDVIEAVDGQEAVDGAQEHQPDLIFLDIHMPKMNGLEALEEIRDRDPNVPVDLLLSRDGAGGPYEVLATGISNSGSYGWTVTGPVVNGPRGILRVIVSDSGPTVGQDDSDGGFRIKL